MDFIGLEGDDQMTAMAANKYSKMGFKVRASKAGPFHLETTMSQNRYS
jgi:hypothetical protein